jgi:hypothetical protein
VRCLALLLLLAGCAAQQGPLPPLDQNIQDLLANLKAVSIADLNNAEAIAVANNDALMAPCYPALIQFVQSFAGASGTVSGAFSAFEMTRVTRIGLSGGLPDYLKLGCAAGVVDEAQFITRLGAMLGAASVLGPIVPVVVPPLAPAPPPNKAINIPQNIPHIGESVTMPAARPPPMPAMPLTPKEKPAAIVNPAATALSEMAETDRLLALASVHR